MTLPTKINGDYEEEGDVYTDEDATDEEYKILNTGD
jgi:hypothetical protein